MSCVMDSKYRNWRRKIFYPGEGMGKGGGGAAGWRRVSGKKLIQRCDGMVARMIL